MLKTYGLGVYGPGVKYAVLDIRDKFHRDRPKTANWWPPSPDFEIKLYLPFTKTNNSAKSFIFVIFVNFYRLVIELEIYTRSLMLMQTVSSSSSKQPPILQGQELHHHHQFSDAESYVSYTIIYISIIICLLKNS